MKTGGMTNWDQTGDGELLAAFVREGRQDAFAEIVRRHGGLVLRVCRSVLGSEPDAEDAVQAVFLTLIRKAASLAGHPTLAGWLHLVAWHVASRQRQSIAARMQHEREAVHMKPDFTRPVAIDIPEDLLHKCLSGLSEKYRLPLILHHLEGRPQEEVAGLLNSNVGTISSRLTRGRQMLRERLVRSGLAVSVVGLAAAMASEASAAGIAPALAASIAKMTALTLAAKTAASANVMALSKGALNMLFIAKIKIAAMATAAFLLVGGTAAGTYMAVAAGPGGPAAAPAMPFQAPASPSEPPKAGRETDIFPGARSASGTVFLDANDNGKLDPGEKGMSGIRVTAAREIAVTDSGGKYKLSSKTPFYTASVSFPDGTWPTGQWFVRMSKNEETDLNFGLREDKQKLPLLFVHFTDPHNAHPKTMPMLRKECEALPLKPKFYVCTGDLRSGDPSVQDIDGLNKSFTAIGANFSKFGAPLFMTPGNHDTVGYGGQGKAFGPGDATHPFFANGCWEYYVCPSYWSFSCANVHFMGTEYALWIDGKWNKLAPATASWIEGEVKALPAGARTIFFTHAPNQAAENVKKYGLTLGLAGDSHWVGRYFAKTVYPENVLQAGTCQVPVENGKPSYTSDGYPEGYRLVMVETDRIDTFYKPLGAERTIMINVPRICPKDLRNFQAPAAGPLAVEGQVFDLEGKVSAVRVKLGANTVDAKITRRRLWTDFEAKTELKDPSDFASLCVTASFPDGAYSVTPGRSWEVEKSAK